MISRNVVVAAVVCLVGTLAALIFGLSLTGHLDGNSTPLVTEMLGIVVTTIPALLALNSAEKAKQAASEAKNVAQSTSDDLHNGVLKNKVKEALVEASNDSKLPTIAPPDSPPIQGNSNG